MRARKFRCRDSRIAILLSPVCEGYNVKNVPRFICTTLNTAVWAADIGRRCRKVQRVAKSPR
jgi:hypothetical protein